MEVIRKWHNIFQIFGGKKEGDETAKPEFSTKGKYPSGIFRIIMTSQMKEK